MNLSVALRLGRISNLPTVWSNVLAGVVLAGVAPAVGQVAVLIAALSLLYTAGMYLNDAFDRDIDARERAERPIPSGQVSATTVFGAGYAMMIAALALLVFGGYAAAGGTGWRGAAVGLALAATIVFYDWRHKDLAASPVIMGLCRMLTYILAGYAVTRAVPPALFVASGAMLCYLIGLTYAAKQETLGRVRNLWPLTFIAAPFAYGLEAALDTLPAALFTLLFLGWTLYALSFLMRRGRIDVPRAVICLIAGISLLDAMLIAGAGEPALALLAAAGCPLTLALQRFVRGT